MKPREWLGWIGLVLLPLAVDFAMFAALPLPDTMAMHFGLDGTPDRWGSKYELLVIGGIMSGANLLMALMYWKIEALFAMGLVNGVKTIRGARIVLWVTGAFIVVLTVGASIFLVSTALAAA